MIIKTVLRGINEIEGSTNTYTKEVATAHCTLSLYMTDEVYLTLDISQLLNSYVSLELERIDDTFRNYEVKSVTYIKGTGGGSDITDLSLEPSNLNLTLSTSSRSFSASLSPILDQSKEYTDKEIGKLGSGLEIKDTVQSVSDLPTAGVGVGDAYFVRDEQSLFVWKSDGTWLKLGSLVDILVVSVDDRHVGELINLGNYNPYKDTIIPTQNYIDQMIGACYVTPITSLYIGEGFVTSTGSSNTGGVIGVDIYDDLGNKLDQILGVVNFESGDVEGRFVSDPTNLVNFGSYSSGTIVFNNTISLKFPIADKLYLYFNQDYDITSGTIRTIVGGRRSSDSDPANFNFPIDKFRKSYVDSYMSFIDASGNIIVYKTVVNESGEIRRSDNNNVIGSVNWNTREITSTLTDVLKTLTIVDARADVDVDDSIIRLDGEQILDKTGKPYLNEAYNILKTYPDSVILDENRIRVPKIDNSPAIGSSYIQVVGKHLEPTILYPNTIWQQEHDGDSVTLRTSGSLSNESRSNGIQPSAIYRMTGTVGTCKDGNTSWSTRIFKSVSGGSLQASDSPEGTPSGVYGMAAYGGSSSPYWNIRFDNASQTQTTTLEAGRMRNVEFNIWTRIG